ncbi:MAG TPA: class I SAM-dependent methyltransferase [Tessaracoccus flavescens]|uniref:Class I SAM-dependent methyltransferase n=1 Tax=Tessaracoccus flavescens TaxID=399497 RepID=A0A921EMF7_9ACTN|nr:class I SAM-dependent methyltransferase [Tessaracoccus flavescens]
MTRTAIPVEALDWLAVWRGVRGLILGTEAHFPARLANAGHHPFVLTDSREEVERLGQIPHVTPILARPEAIPTDPFQFEVVFVHQSLHRYDLAESLPQIARVLRPGGCLSASYLIRDDSVPWVRRLAALLRRFDPMAMKGDYGHASLDTLRESKYFKEVEDRAFRVWQRVSRDDLVALVTAQPFTANLDEEQLGHLISQVTDLYDGAVRPGEALRLPFQMICCRAWVDHEELTGPVRMPDNGLAIPL